VRGVQVRGGSCVLCWDSSCESHRLIRVDIIVRLLEGGKER
jgi:hypothetical protein